MIRSIIYLIILLLICGCSATDPVTPDYSTEPQGITASETDNPHRLWGYYNLVFDREHTRCDVYPVRTASFHLNGLKFLEQTPCTNCLRVSNFKKPDDNVIELDVTIRHPYAALEYSCFDVRGIIMFNGSWNCATGLNSAYPELSRSVYVSWARLGDWELINPDGYSYYWSTLFNPDSNWPITHYLPGKFSNGTPTATLNACRNFYTDEDRHLFRAGHQITRTYRIQTQPGPMIVGYAIDACWEPPTKTPVTNPIEDFPPSANAPEPYFFEVIINDGETVTYPHQLQDMDSGAVKLIIKQWNGMTVDKTIGEVEFEIPMEFPDDGDDRDRRVWTSVSGQPLIECEPSCGDCCYCGPIVPLDFSYPYEPAPAGWYRVVVSVYAHHDFHDEYYDYAVDITDFYYDPG
jgi:hypothetical protein